MNLLLIMLVSAALVLSALTGAGGAAEADPQVTSPPSMTTEALVAEVLARNPEIGFYRAEIAAARAGKKTAAEWSNPEVTFDLGQKKAWERGSGNSLGDGAAWSVSLVQPFEFPGRVSLRKAIADRQVGLAELGLRQFRAALAARARSLAWVGEATQEKARVAREVEQRLQALSEVLVQREVAGVTPLLDMRIIEANALVLSRRASQALQSLQTARIELNLLRGQPPHTPLTLSAAAPTLTNLPPLEVLLGMARTNNYELRTRQTELAQQGFRVQLSRNERWPKVTLAPFYSSEKAADEEQIVGVGVTVPLPLWNQNKGAIQASQARLQQAETMLMVTARDVERRVTEHALAYQNRIEEMSRYRHDSRVRLQEAAELADRHYRLGAVPLATYIEMQMRYLDAVEALLATQEEALEHRQQVVLLTGSAVDQTLP
jgi:outer membrane protein, heavy metal efflux system